MKIKKRRISRSFLKGLLIVVAVAFIATTVFLWVFQTNLAERNASNLLKLNIKDVKQDITDASNEHLLKLSWEIADELNSAEAITTELLNELTVKYDVTEISCVNEEGIITVTTYPDFMNFDMRTGKQSAEFMVLLSGEKEYVQEYGPVSYDQSISRKYGGVILEKGGFVQVGYGAERFQRDIDEFVIGVTKNRHVGEKGCMIIVDEKYKIVSGPEKSEGSQIDITGIALDKEKHRPGEKFLSEYYGEKCYCMYHEAEGYLILAVIPKSEAALSRNVAVVITMIMQVIIFLSLFIMIYLLVKRLVVNNIYRINDSLSEITEGNLETVVDVRTHVEFEELSDDINSTVDTLKRYIADAKARIGAELVLAKAIQHSALPSVFPPYPNRKDFEIWADMYTAKEVGGDFYDFYFVNKDTLAFLIADVSGKGIPAAMFMMTAKTLIKSYAESGMSVEEVFTQANAKLSEGNDSGMFVTAWMGYIDLKTGRISYANAGHNPPLVRHGNGSYEYLKTRPGLVLAGMEGIRYRSNVVELQPGDVIFLYTDGVTEANNASEELYGTERLKELLDSNTDKDAEHICEVVKADVDSFADGVEQFDDITMLCIRYNGADNRKE